MKCVRCGSPKIVLSVKHGERILDCCCLCLELLVREFVTRKEDVDELKVS